MIDRQKSISTNIQAGYDFPMRNIKPNYRPRVAARQEQFRGVSLDQAARDFQKASRADNTTHTYQSGQKQFKAFCRENDFEVFPGDPEAVRQFLVYLAIRKGLSIATVKVRFAALRRMYRDELGRRFNVTDTDAVRDCLEGLIRTLAEAPVQAPSLGATQIRQIVRALGKGDGKAWSVRALRDRALLLVTYAGAFRRSEVSALLRCDCLFEADGVRILLRRSKTDQQSDGEWIGIGFGKRSYTCPVRCMRAWFDVSPDCEYVFTPVSRGDKPVDEQLQPKGVGRIVKSLAHKAGLDPEAFTAHSLRAGMTTDLNEAGVSTAMVQQRTRHRSTSMVARYHRPGTVLKTNYTRRAGL